MKKNAKNEETKNMVMNEQAPTMEAPQEEVAQDQSAAIKALMDKAAEAKAAYEAARQAAKQAKELAKLANARPLRDHYYEARTDALDPSTAFKKMETFYYVEKALVDYINEGKALGELRRAAMVRITKDPEHPTAELLIANYRVDPSTLQIVIEA